MSGIRCKWIKICFQDVVKESKANQDTAARECKRVRFSFSLMEAASATDCCMFFPECVARVPVSLGGLGVRLCSPSFAFATATVRNRSQPFATVRNRLR